MHINQACAVVLLLASTALARDKVALEARFPEGRYLLGTSTTMTQKVTADGEPQPDQRVEQAFTLGLDVSAPDDAGTQTVALTYRAFKQIVRMGRETVAYDSADPPDEQDPSMARAIGPMMKTTITVRLGPGAEVREATGLDALWERLAKENPPLAPLFAEMRASMGNDMIENLLGHAARFLPAGPVAVGDTWQVRRNLSVPVAGTSAMTFECTLASLEDDGKTAVITLDGASATGPGRPSDVGSGTLKIEKGTYRQTGTLRFDRPLGLALRQEVSQDGKVTMTLEDAAGATTRAEGKLTLKREITLTPEK